MKKLIIVLFLILWALYVNAQYIYKGTISQSISKGKIKKEIINEKKTGYIDFHWKDNNVVIDGTQYNYISQYRGAWTDSCCETYMDEVIKISCFEEIPQHYFIITQFIDNRLVVVCVKTKWFYKWYLNIKEK